MFKYFKKLFRKQAVIAQCDKRRNRDWSIASGDKGGWICCCDGAILDHLNPAKSMVCCKNYIWVAPERSKV
jgi:hypothetical protein